KVDGSARFGIDVKLPGMLYAALQQCPVIGGTLKSVDAAKARAMPGVVDVVQIPDGVAVVADSWWRAHQARQALVIDWDEGRGAALDDKSMLAGTRAALQTGKPMVIKSEGDPDAVIAASQRVVRRDYVSQLLSHSRLPPMTLRAHDDACAAPVPHGMPAAMTLRMASQSVSHRVLGIPLEAQDPLMIEAAVAPYRIPATRHDVVKHDAGLRVGYWRSVSHLLNAFANESFIDELAREAGRDPYEYRLALVAGQPRFVNVLKLAADKAAWGKPLPAGRARGIALMEGYGTHLALVAEVSLDNEGAVRVHRVTVAADLG